MWRNIQEFLDLVAPRPPIQQVPTPSSSQPTPYFAPPVRRRAHANGGRVRHYGYRKAGLLINRPVGTVGQALQQRLIADGDQMPGLPVPRARR